MTQQIISLGSGPDSQTGDSLYTAFVKTNENFNELYSVFAANGITTINANVIYSNSIVTSTNVRTGNLFAYGNIESIGYVITSGIFYPNGAPIGALSSIDTSLIPLVSNVYTLGNSTNQFSTGYFGTNISLAGANLTVVGGQLLLNGQQATGGSSYSNSNVASYLPIYSGNLNSVNSLTAYTGNIRGNLSIGGNLFVSGNITYQNVETGNLEVANTITASGNITAQYFLGNGRYLSGLNATSIQNGTSNVKVYSNSNVNITTAGSNTWVFDTAGIVTLPNGGKLGPLQYADGIDLFASNVMSYSQVNYDNKNYIYVDSSVAQLQTPNVFITADTNGNKAWITVTDPVLSQTSNWVFNANGKLSLPAANPSETIATQNGYITVGNLLVGQGGSLFNTNNDSWTLYGNLSDPGVSITIPSNAAAANLVPLSITSFSNVEISSGGTWVFGTDGSLALPSLRGQIGLDGYTNGIDLYNNNGGSGYVRMNYGDQSYVWVDPAGSHIQTTGGTWDFDTVGDLTAPGNIAASYFIGNFVGNISGNISAAGANTQVLFNDNGTVNGTSGFTFDKTTNLAIISGTVSANQVDVAGYNVIDSNGNIVTSRLVDSGVDAGTYGNSSSVPSITVDSKGRVTAVSNVAVAGVSNVNYNNTTGNLTVSTSSGTNYVVDLGVGTADSPNFSGLTISGNATVNALTVNNSTSIGGTLGVTGNATIGNISGVGRIISTDTTNATGTGTGAFIVVGGGSVTQDFWVGGNLYATNLIATTSSNITVQDPLLYLVANVPYPYSYEIGIYSDFNPTGSNYQHTGFIRDHSDNVWKLASNLPEPGGSTINFTNAIYDSIKFGPATILGAIVANSTLSLGGNATANGLTVNNSVTIGSTLGVTGNVTGSYFIGNGSALTTITGANVTGTVPLATTATYVTGLTGTNVNVALGYVPLNSNATALTAQYVTQAAQANITSVGVLTGVTTSGNATISALTVNNSATIGSTLSVTGNVIAPYFIGNIVGNITGNVAAAGSNTQVLFNDNNSVNANVGLTFNKVTGTLTTVIVNAATIGNTNAIHIGNGAALTTLTGANVTGTVPLATTATYVTGLTGTNVNVALGYVPLNSNATALTAQYVTQAAQANITSVGTLTGLTTSGNINGSGITLSSSATVGGTLGVTGNVTIGPGSGGNISGADVISANTGTFTANVTGSYFIGNGSTLTGIVGANVSGTVALATTATYVTGLTGTNVNVALGYIPLNSNATALTAQYVTQAAQANITSVGVLTSLNTSGNATINALTVNNSATIGSTLSVTGNVIAPYFIGNIVGNITGNVAAAGSNTQVLFNDNNSVNANVGLTFNKATQVLTTVTLNAATIGNTGATIIGNGSALTSITGANVSGTVANATYALQSSQAANANTAITATYVTGLTGTNVNVALGYVPLNSNATALTAQYVTQAAQANITSVGTLTGLTLSGTLNGTTVQAATIGNTGATLTGATLTISGNAVVGNLDVLGNVTYINSTVTDILDPIIELNTTANGAPLSGNAPYDSGIKTHYWDGSADRQSFFGRTNDTGNFEFYSNVTSETGNVVTGTYGTIKTGNIVLTGTSSVASTLAVGANATVNGLVVNTSATIGTTLGVTGNVIVGNLTTAGLIKTTATTAATSNVTGAVQVSGGIGVGGSVYVGNKVGWVDANSVSVVYQYYNAATGSLDTVFG